MYPKAVVQSEGKCPSEKFSAPSKGELLMISPKTIELMIMLSETVKLNRL